MTEDATQPEVHAEVPAVQQQQPQQQEVHEERAPRDPNTIYIGKKPPMSYVLAAVTQFNSGSNEVKVKARGRSISTAVDVTQIVKNRFINDIKIEMMDISTEELQSEDGTMRKVSSVTLAMRK